MALVGVIGWPQETNVELVAAWRDRGIPAELVAPPLAARVLGPGDVAVGRLDVLPTLDGVEPGLEVLSELARRGVRVLNGSETLLRAHDKLFTVGRRLYAISKPGVAFYASDDECASSYHLQAPALPAGGGGAASPHRSPPPG